MKTVGLGELIVPAPTRRAGEQVFPVLSMTMRDGLVNQSEKFKKRIASADTSPYKVVERNQLVVGFPIDEGVLAFQRLYDEAIVSPAYNIWNLKDAATIDARYLEQFLRSPRALAFYRTKLRSTTARRRSLPNDEFLSLPVSLPPLAEQERIVNLLDQADELRKLRAQADRRAANLIPALFHEMFGDGQSFPTKALIELVDAGRGISYGVVQRGNHFPGGVPLLLISNFGKNYFAPYDMVAVDPIISAQYRRTVLDGGELVVSIRGTVGRVAIVPAQAKGWNVAREIAVIPLLPGVSRPFLHAYMLSSFAQNFITNEVRGIAQRGINLADLRRLPVPLPPESMQNEFAQRVTEIRALEAEQAASRTRLYALFQSMLHRAFKGEL